MSVVIVLCLVVGDIRGDDDESAEKKPDSKTDKLMAAMRKRAEGIKVFVRVGDERSPAVPVADPLLRYNDVPRRIRDSSLWCWRFQGRPVALLKTNVREKKPQTRWLDGINSLTNELIVVEWADGHRFASRKPGLIRTPIVDGPAAAEKPRVRLQQMKELAKRFAVTIAPNEGGRQEMRLLARQLDRYSSPDHDLIDGALFGFTTNGTNPDALLVIELAGRDPASGTWNYGFAQMTTGGLVARLDEREIWTATQKEPIPTDFDEWGWFYAPFVDEED